MALAAGSLLIQRSQRDPSDDRRKEIAPQRGARLYYLSIQAPWEQIRVSLEVRQLLALEKK